MTNHAHHAAQHGDLPIHKSPSARVVDPREKPRPCSDPTADRTFLEAHREELSTLYPDEWVAVSGGKLVGHGKKIFELTRSVYESTGRAGMLISFTGSRRPVFDARGEESTP